MCYIVHCPSLTSLNGMYRCNLGSDGVTSYEDICHLICNIGYEVIGGDTRTCQSDGSWSGTINTCSRGTATTTKVDFIVYEFVVN